MDGVGAVRPLREFYSRIDLVLLVDHASQTHITLPRGHVNIKAIHSGVF